MTCSAARRAASRAPSAAAARIAPSSAVVSDAYSTPASDTPSSVGVVLPLQVFDGDAELAGDSSQRLHRWRSRAGLDPRDVRIADAWRGKVALRHAALKPQSLQSRTNALPPRHGAIFPRAPVSNSQRRRSRLNASRKGISKGKLLGSRSVVTRPARARSRRVSSCKVTPRIVSCRPFSWKRDRAGCGRVVAEE